MVQTLSCSTREMLQHGQNHPEYLLQEKGQSRKMKAYKEDRLLRGRQIAYLIYEYFRVTGANDSVENYADLFTIALRNDDIQEFDSKWDGVLLSMTQIPSDDILEGLYKLRRRESEKLKTVLELYNMEIHQKKAEPDLRFRSVNLHKEFEYRSKIEEMGTATTIELTTRSTERNPTMCEVT